jgi:hypothetical protein
MISPDQLRKSPVVQRLPDVCGVNRGDALPEKILGARIVQFGTVPDAGWIEGAGLVVDYYPMGSSVLHRTVFAFNELGMWIVLDDDLISVEGEPCGCPNRILPSRD